MTKDKFLKFGGVKFKAKVPPKRLNKFVENLAESDKDSMYEVAKALNDMDMIELEHAFSTIDDDPSDC